MSADQQQISSIRAWTVTSEPTGNVQFQQMSSLLEMSAPSTLSGHLSSCSPIGLRE
jgi:hypothetical protein